MEQIPPQGGDLQDTQAPHVPPSEQTPHDQPPPQAPESPDERIIREGIEQAQHNGTDIDDRTARYIASQLHEDQASALYSLASTGTIAESVQDELNQNLDQQASQVQTWITWLGAYCLNREHKGPVPSWTESAAAIDQTEEEERTPVELMARIATAATTTLGKIAVVVTAEQAPEDAEEAQYWEQLQNEYHAFMRATRAAQTPTRAPATQADNSKQLGHDHRNNTDTDYPHLNSRSEDTGHSEQEAHTPEQTPTHHPEIWVGSLSDYTNGHLHGTLLDATLDPDDLYRAIQFILRTGHDPTAEEWAIMDYDDFCRLNLGEYEPLEVISRIANGIAEHGEAFAKWAEYVGERSEELLADERFQDHYLGHFDSVETYVENPLEETDGYEFEEFVPEWLKPYVKG